MKSIVFLFKLPHGYRTILSNIFLITTVIVNLYWKHYITGCCCVVVMWHCGVVVITTAQLHSTKPELRFCAGSKPAHAMSEIRDGEDL